MLHYSPIQATVEGEPAEIFPFLGSSRLEEPLNRYRSTPSSTATPTAASRKGKTAPACRSTTSAVRSSRHAYPDRPPFRIFEVPVEEPAVVGAGT